MRLLYVVFLFLFIISQVIINPLLFLMKPFPVFETLNIVISLKKKAAQFNRAMQLLSLLCQAE